MDISSTDTIRRAITGGDWTAASALWADHAAAIEKRIADGKCPAALLEEARDLLDWARRVVLCARTQAQEQLNALHAARQYGDEPAAIARLLRTSL